VAAGSLRHAPAPQLRGGALPAPTSADANELTVLAAVIGRDEPISLGRIARLTGLMPDEARAALAGLRRAGLVRQLNTVVESYTAHFR
jgi:hypothetical protein